MKIFLYPRPKPRSMHDQKLGSIPTIKNQVQYPRACSWVLIVGIACTVKTHDQNLGACTNRSPLQDLPQLNRGATVSFFPGSDLPQLSQASGSEWVWWASQVEVSESEFWSVLGCVFYLFGVRVTENIEVGYRALMVRITDGQSVKI